MFGSTQPQTQANTRHFPANPSLNKNADGFVCCINMTHNEIQKSRFESRLEYFLQGKPKSSNIIAGGLGVGAPLGGALGLGGFQGQQQPSLFGQQPPAQQQNFGQPTFGQQTTLIGQTQPQGGGLFNTLGQSQQQPLFGGAQQTQGGGLFQQQPQNGGLFGMQAQPQQQQPQQGGLFGGLSQGLTGQQTGGGLFGATSQAMAPQSGTLFGQNTASKPLFGATQNSGQPQGYSQPQPIYIQQMPAQENTQLYVNLNLDYNELDDIEGLHLKEIEDNFRSGLPTFSETFNSPSPVYNINIPSKQNINISVNRQYPSRLIYRNPHQMPQQTRSTQQTQPSSRISQSNLNQSYQRPSMNRNQQKEVSQNSQVLERSSMRSQIREDDSESFTLSQISQGRTVTKLVTFNQIGFNKEKGSKVKDFKEALIKHMYKNQIVPPNLVIVDSSNNVAVIRADSCNLDEIKFRGNKTIISILSTGLSVAEEEDEDEQEYNQFDQTEPKSARFPTIYNESAMLTTPDIEQLQEMSEEQLSRLSNFSVETKFGKIEFLESVDVRGLELDRIIVFTQDSVEFYPEDFGQQTPDRGSGINVKCQITFYNFGDASKKMKTLRISDFTEFKKKVQAWAFNLDMELVNVSENGNVQVILQSI